MSVFAYMIYIIGVMSVFISFMGYLNFKSETKRKFDLIEKGLPIVEEKLVYNNFLKRFIMNFIKTFIFVFSCVVVYIVLKGFLVG